MMRLFFYDGWPALSGVVNQIPARQTGIVILESASASQKLQTRLIWHHRAHYDPALTWLRGLFVKHSVRKTEKTGKEALAEAIA